MVVICWKTFSAIFSESLNIINKLNKVIEAFRIPEEIESAGDMKFKYRKY